MIVLHNVTGYLSSRIPPLRRQPFFPISEFPEASSLLQALATKTSAARPTLTLPQILHKRSHPFFKQDKSMQHGEAEVSCSIRYLR